MADRELVGDRPADRVGLAPLGNLLRKRLVQDVVSDGEDESVGSRGTSGVGAHGAGSDLQATKRRLSIQSMESLSSKLEDFRDDALPEKLLPPISVLHVCLQQMARPFLHPVLKFP